MPKVLCITCNTNRCLGIYSWIIFYSFIQLHSFTYDTNDIFMRPYIYLMLLQFLPSGSSCIGWLRIRFCIWIGNRVAPVSHPSVGHHGITHVLESSTDIKEKEIIIKLIILSMTVNMLNLKFCNIISNMDLKIYISCFKYNNYLIIIKLKNCRIKNFVFSLLHTKVLQHLIYVPLI